jgi:two-component system sensor histidine kinase KdpD
VSLFVPLIGSQRVAGAVVVRPRDLKRFDDPEQRRLLETCASLVALSLERDQSVLQAHEAQMQVQAEQLRSSLLSSISHDLRTPLAAIAGTSSSLLEAGAHYDGTMRYEMLQSLVEESHRMVRLVDNLLDMMRLDCGAVVLNKQWHVLEEIIGTALSRMRRDLQNHPVRVDVAADLPLVSVDGVLMEQMFVNLLENAARYTPADSQIEIGANRKNGSIEIRVADCGPGLPPGSEARVFQKFYRGTTSTADGRRGVGLGLAICQAVIQAHGGQIAARNRPTGGAEFTITLPCPEVAPQVVLDEIPGFSNA